MASNVTLTSLRQQARRRADMVNSNFVADDELDEFLNESLLELYDVLTMHYGDEYFHTTHHISIGPTSNFYALPGDFYKLKGVEISQNATNPPTRYVSVVPFMFPERNRYAYNSTQLPSRTIRLRYVPTGKRLVDTSTTTQTFETTDVDTTNDVITETDHGYSTGDIVQFTTTGGLPAPLALSTDYFIIRKTDDTFALGLTLQNAFDEVLIDLTTVGSGTQTIGGSLNKFDFVNGWEAYVIWRAAEMMLEKEESDTTTAARNVQRQMARIEQAGSNRDAGHPQRIVDIDDINDIELRIFQETNIRYRVNGRNIEFIYVGYLGV